MYALVVVTMVTICLVTVAMVTCFLSNCCHGNTFSLLLIKTHGGSRNSVNEDRDYGYQLYGSHKTSLLISKAVSECEKTKNRLAFRISN